jgi:predicted nucleotidyltransferase component of viral defense system
MDNLKVEFTFFPFENIKEYDFYNKNLRINNVLDIAVNKIHAISERLEVKDLYDIYFILQNEEITLNDLFI